MSNSRLDNLFFILASFILLVSASACNTTRYLKEGEYLLKENNIKLKSDKPITRKGELKATIEGLIAQEPNRKFLGLVPLRLWLYNARYEKYQKDTANFQVRSNFVEPPVIYDSSTITKSIANIKGYLYHQGYFYASVRDTAVFRDKKAYVTYYINTGNNYLIDNVTYDINDSLINAIVRENSDATVLKKNTEYSFSLLELEQTRITELLRDKGYYKFNKSFVNFELDTLNKKYLRDIENPFESAINFIALQKDEKKPTLNIKTIIRADEDEPNAYSRYGIRRLRVLPDYENASDFRDSTMIIKNVGDVQFRYHDYYVNERVIYNQLQLEPNTFYSQSKYDQTISKLNELGIFQSVRIGMLEDSTGMPWLNTAVLLSPAKKYDFSPSIEIANSSTNNATGTSLAFSLRNRNFARGANQLVIAASAGIEYAPNPQTRKFELFSRRAGINATINLPKFLLPVSQSNFVDVNTPRTIFATGVNLLDRVNLFTLINTSASINYRWNETNEKQWNISPAFINYINLPYISDSFQKQLDDYPILEKTYSNTFIQGENISFTYTNKQQNVQKDYSYLRLAFEEAGGIVNSFVDTSSKNSFAQYLKFDGEIQHFLTRLHSVLAMRFYSGIGVPYGANSKTQTLPYIKQYFAGGPYSIRGWRVRSLGPGSYLDTSTTTTIDATGDIKLEANLEYRFDIVKIFAGAAQLNGAVFADAGNIWLTNPSDAFPGGQFRFDTFLNDVAVSSGFGLRVDIGGLFVLRGDVGIPVRRPYYNLNRRNQEQIADNLTSSWQFNNYNFDWLLKNSVLSFAIGYPF